MTGIYFDNENNRFYGKPEMHISKSMGMSALKLIRAFRGRNRYAAFECANDIDYQLEIEHSRITLAPYFIVEPLDDWKNQRLKIILYLPENTIIILDESLCYSGIIVKLRRSRHDSNACKWIVTKNGIEAID
jgi:hypothetical protein